MDFVDKNVSTVEPVKPFPVDFTTYTLVENLDDLKELAAKLRCADEFAVILLPVTTMLRVDIMILWVSNCELISIAMLFHKRFCLMPVILRCKFQIDVFFLILLLFFRLIWNIISIDLIKDLLA